MIIQDRANILRPRGRIHGDTALVARHWVRAEQAAEGDALFASGGVNVYVLRPDGRPTGAIPVGETTTSLSFGDANRKTLYITSDTGLFKAAVETPGLVR